LRFRLAIATLILASAIGWALAPRCTAQAAGSEPWGAEIDQPTAADPAVGAGDTGKTTSKVRRRKVAAGEGTGRLSLSGDQTATMLRLELDAAADYDVFTLPDPYRVIVEMTAGLAADRAKGAGHGLVERYHSGRLEQGKNRIVLETLGPVKATLFPEDPAVEGRKVVEVALTPMPVQEFGRGSGSLKARDLPKFAAAPAGAAAGLGAGAMPAPPSRPVIVIDPGHGGIDPGAVGSESLLEKNIVMAVAVRLQAALAAKDRYQVHLTRTTDTFVSLDQRVGISRKHAANLFISLHADSIEAAVNTASISGATVYTLSERASDEQARIMAEKENASDLLGGISADSGKDDEVKDILIDLIKRETASFSAEFASVLRTNLRKSVQLSRDPMRSAAFKVLKQPHAPSVLLELGYMSNAGDAKRLNSPEWQEKVADAIATAVDAYFSSRLSRAK
jgi:N-acetylmuramoyl-L-alanine amidase